MIRQFVGDLRREFGAYSLQGFQRDLLSGVTVAAVALPLALAFGVGSGADAAAGLITAVLAGLLIGGLSGAPFQISGPTGAMTAILMSVVAQYQLHGMFVACFLAGVIMLAAGLLRCGKLISFIPLPVISGFTSGIAIVIALGQLDNFFGVKSQGHTTVEKLLSYRDLGFPVNWASVAVGALVILCMVFWPRRLAARLPSSLGAIILALLANVIFTLPVAVVGEVPSSLIAVTRLSFAAIPWAELEGLVMPAISIAALGMIESLLCGVAGSRMAEKPFNADRELVAQGIGNIIIPFFGGVPATAAIARTSVAIKSGGRTRLVSIIHALVLMASMWALGPLMSKIPLSALAGVLMVTAFRMNNWQEIQYIFGRKLRGAMVKFLVTMGVTVVFDLTIAIVAGMVVSVLIYVTQSANMEISTQEVDPERIRPLGIHVTEDSGHMVVAYLSGDIFFGTIEKLRLALLPYKKADLIILSMRGVPMMDTSGLHGLQELHETLRENGATVMFTAIQPRVREVLDRSGLTEIIGTNLMFWSTDQAVAAFLQAREAEAAVPER